MNTKWSARNCQLTTATIIFSFYFVEKAMSWCIGHLYQRLQRQCHSLITLRCRTMLRECDYQVLGTRVFFSPHVCKSELVKRNWCERLFSWPWRPWMSTRMISVPVMYRVGIDIFSHP